MAASSESIFAGCFQGLQCLEGLLGKPKCGGTWAQYSNIDMCGQGDVEIIHDWESKTTIEELKKKVEQNNYSAITVSAGKPSFKHAALKNFDYQLTPEHCKPITTCCKHPCTIYIYTPNDSQRKKPFKEAPPPPPKLPFDSEAPTVVLVKAGSPNALKFEHAEALVKGKDFVALTLKSPQGKAVVNQQETETTHAHFHLIRPAVGEASIAICARLEDGFLTREDNSYVFDVEHWKYAEDNKLWMLKEHEDASQRSTRNPDGGRSFKVNMPDGTISPVRAPHLVLGLGAPSVVLVPKDSPKRCIFEHAGELSKGNKEPLALPLTLTSPGAGSLSISVKSEKVNIFHNIVQYVLLGIGPAKNALYATYEDGGFLAREKIIETTTLESARGDWAAIQAPTRREYSMVFDVAFSKMEVGNVVNIVQHIDEQHGGTRNLDNKGRIFVVNDDGTIGPKTAPHLVLGVEHILI